MFLINKYKYYYFYLKTYRSRGVVRPIIRPFRPWRENRPRPGFERR